MQRIEPSGNLIVKRYACSPHISGRALPRTLSELRAPPCRLSKFAKLPVRGSALAAGYDLAAAQPCVIPAHGKGLVKTDLAIIVPEGCYGRIGERCAPRIPRARLNHSSPRRLTCDRSAVPLIAAPRSGLAWKNFIDTGAGVIDADYRGNVGVLLFNHADTDFNGT
jgi:dUTP pyrophosphatase